MSKLCKAVSTPIIVLCFIISTVFKYLPRALTNLENAN